LDNTIFITQFFFTNLNDLIVLAAEFVIDLFHSVKLMFVVL